MYYYSYIYYIIPGLLLAMYAQSKIATTYAKYKKVQSIKGLSGAEVAKIIMDKRGLRGVEINLIEGKLSDNYDPRSRVLNLSREVYQGRSLASVGIAAHEVGHALQHEFGYAPLSLRSILLPAAQIGSNLSMTFIIFGLIFSVVFLKIGIALFAMAVIFQIITLPVEFNASMRAQKELADGILTEDELKGTKSVLSAAALTYIASTIVAIGQLLRLLALANNRRR